MAGKRWRFHFVLPTAAALDRITGAGSCTGVTYRVTKRPDGMLEDHELLVPAASPAVRVLAALFSLPGRSIVPPWPVAAGSIADAIKDALNGKKH